ncbi:hypothetical protein HRJ45_12245 [Vibrio coralliilyticus]|uniref:hypothetical protein n=1 Tax=Vibrio coralliilyticus TaxID=190893 RepID=UPI00155F8434|nr:hypothetical protein [Vibrio coralliilyticus]NRF25493.1 hypothetical protein [Vibrio coralliilyticus]NRF79880.1 hypothetical protein [Vibrio coralliilyticus]
MNIDRFKGVIVIVLLLTFFWAGQETNSPNTTLWTFLKDCIALLSSIATLFVAVYALNSWKAQARNSKIDQVVESLSALDKAHKAYSHSVLAQEWKSHADLYQERYRCLTNEFIDHEAKLNLLKRYLDNKTHQSLTGLFTNYRTKTNMIKQYFICRYPDLFLEEDNKSLQINGSTPQSLKNESEQLLKEYTKYLYGIE